MLPLLMGQNLTKGCLPLTDSILQTNYSHNFTAVSPGLFSVCNATNSEHATIKADPHQDWVSLNFISTASIQEFVGKLITVLDNVTEIN
jgi:hypothetical protein